MTDEEKWVNHIEHYCHSGDAEKDHLEADNALKLFLLSQGHSKIVEAWKKVKKWYA